MKPIPDKRHRFSTAVIQHAVWPRMALYRQCHRVENMFGRLQDWRGIHTRYDRRAHTFMSAIVLAATVIFWL